VELVEWGSVQLPVAKRRWVSCASSRNWELETGRPLLAALFRRHESPVRRSPPLGSTCRCGQSMQSSWASRK